jgi:hypothetical protein
MKTRFIILLLFAICSCSVLGQSIRVDRLETDGRRQVMSSKKSVSMQGITYEFCVKVYDKEEKNRSWLLLVASFHPIQENGILLIKLGNGDVLSLPCNNLNVGKIYYSGINVDYYSSVYEISERQLDRISRYGILKLRITDGLSYREKEWKKDKLGKYLGKCWEILSERINTTRIKRDNIFEDF